MEKNFKCWPKGVFRNLSYPEVPVQEIARSSARQWPWRNAIIFGGMEMTYLELDQLSDRFAHCLCTGWGCARVTAWPSTCPTARSSPSPTSGCSRRERSSSP